MRILFLHGWRSVPGGVKQTHLAQHGHEVINPKLADEDFARRCELLKRSTTITIPRSSPARHEAGPAP